MQIPVNITQDIFIKLQILFILVYRRQKNSNKHSRHLTSTKRKENPDNFYLIQRSRKHRYIYIIANKKDKKNILKKLKYPIFDYPKFQNKNYKTDTNITTQGLLI